VLCAPSQATSQRGPEPVDRDAVRVDVERGHLVAAVDDGAVLHGVFGQHRLDVVLRAVEHPRVAGAPDAVAERNRQAGEVPAWAVDRLVGRVEAAHLQQLGGARLEADRTRQPRSFATFEHGHSDPGEGELGGGHQPGRAGSGDQDVGHARTPRVD
jgi:hypothetical protein